MQAPWTPRSGALAALFAAAAIVAASAWGGQAAAATRTQTSLAAGGAGSGIVQAVRPRWVVVRELDGGIVWVRVGPRTVVFVDGVRATLADVMPGFVVQFKGPAAGAARVLRAEDPAHGKKAQSAKTQPASAETV